MRKFRIIALILILTFPATGGKIPKIYHYTTEGLGMVYFGERYSYLVPHVISTFGNAMSFHENTWQYKNPFTNVVLNDFSDIGNGGAITMPLNQVFLGIEPYNFAFSIIPSNERFQWLFNHELTHIVMGDKPNPKDEMWRKLLFGKVIRTETVPLSALWSYLTVPRWYSPRWYHEGIACFMETWMSGGLGRAMGNYDEMYFRSIVAGNQPLYTLVGLDTEGTVVDFQVGANSYLYGTRFVTHLADQYGIDSLKAFYSRTDDSKPFYASQFKKIYGEPVRKAWNKWIAKETEFQQENIRRIMQYPLTPFSPVTGKPLGNVSRYGYNSNTGKIYLAFNNPGKISQIAEIDRNSGRIRKIARLDSPTLYNSTHFAYSTGKNKIYISEQNTVYRSLVEVDVPTGKKKTLIRFSRTGELVFNPSDNSIWGIQHNNGYAVLVKIPEPYNRIVPMYTAEFGKAIFDLDISSDGKLLSASLSGIRGEQSVILFNLEEMEKGKINFRTVFQLEDNTLTQFKFSADNRFLIGTSYYTGVSNVWRIGIETGAFELMTNTETGFFMPLQVSNDSLLVLKFERDGMVPGVIPVQVLNDANSIEFLANRVHRKNPVVEEWSLPPAPRQDFDSTRMSEGIYHPVKRMKLINAFPDMAGFKKTVAVGYRFNFRDMVGLSDLTLFVGGSPWSSYQDKQKVHAQLDWRYMNWKFSAAYNKTNFYDLFGPTLRSRAGYSAGIVYERMNSLRTPFKINYGAGIHTYGDLEVLPQYQNVSTAIRNLHAATAKFGISKLRKTLGGVEDETGYEWKITGSSMLANGKVYPDLVSEQSYGVLVPGIRNTCFWIRNSMGQSFGNKKSELSKFYFGGFRNNYVDWQPAEQYRNLTAFPGVEIDEIPARNFVKTMGELNLKPIRLNNFGATWLYPTYIKSTLFSTHLLTDFDNPDYRRNIVNFGLQIDIQLVLFTYMKTTWSAGYAIKTEEGTNRQDQFMFSLKLLGN